MTKIVQCPSCQKDVEWSDKSPVRPFCSDRCRLLDLGAWADDAYRVPCHPDPLSPDDASDFSAE